MRRLYIRLYALFVVVVISFTIGVFIFNIIGDMDKEVENSEIAFTKFEKAIEYEVQKTLLNDKSSRDSLKRLADVLSIKGFVIQIAPSVGTVFSHPSDSSLFSVVNGNVLVREQSRFLKVFKSEGRVTVGDEEQKVYITLLRSIFPKDSFFMRARTVFFIMLALVLTTCFVLVFLKIITTEKIERVYTSFDNGNINKNTKQMYNYSTPSGQTLNPFADGYENLGGTYQKMGSENIEQLKSFSHNEDQKLSPTTTFHNNSVPPTYELNKINDFDKKYLSNPILNNNESTSLSNKEPSMDVNANKDEPKGLYSPGTGLSWKSYLPDRLDAELGRASAIDQDMSFVIIKILDVDYSTIDLKRLAEMMIASFKFKDMVFEYSDDTSLGFAGILQDAYVDEAMKLCNSLLSKLRHEIYLTGQEPTIKMGITTRGCRLLSARVMIIEAEKALDNAMKNENESIVGFKPNAEKYRQNSAINENENK